MAKPKYPTLKGFVEKSAGYKQCDLIHCWCPFCNTFHTHGWDGDPKSRNMRLGGHRVAHCFTNNNPFNDTGYYVKPFSKTDLKKLGVKRICLK